MHLVTLTSDWKNDDFYTGAIIGKLAARCTNVQIHSLSNTIKPHNIAEAAFVIRNSYLHFPPGTIHINAVSSDPAKDSAILAFYHNEHYFISADNGFISLLGDGEDTEVVKLEVTATEYLPSFPELTVFTDAACSIIEGKSLKELGTPVTNFARQIPLRATLENDTITGAVIYLDSFGNAITNISRELFERIGKSRSFNIYVQSKHYRISKLNNKYSETEAGDLLALFNSAGLLEIAIRNGSAKDLLNLNTDSTIRVEFK